MWKKRGLTSVVIPDSVITIGKGAFRFCSFDKVTIVNGVKESGRAREEISLAGIDNSIDFSLSGKKLPPFIQGRQGETFCKVPLGKQGELSRSDGGDFW